MNLRALRGAALCAAWVLAAPGAQAGRSCENKPPSVTAIQRSLNLAERTAAKLDESGAQVVVLARAGQDLGAYGLRYSHLGLAYRESPPARDGKPVPGVWRVVHKLNECGTAHAAVYRQGLGDRGCARRSNCTCPVKDSSACGIRWRVAPWCSSHLTA